MEEWGIGPLREKEGLWDELFVSPWDRKVRIHELTFRLKKVSDSSFAPSEASNGMVVSLNLEFGPATLLTSFNGESSYGEIGQVLEFKVFDSQG